MVPCKNFDSAESSGCLRILVIEDDPRDLVLIREAIRDDDPAAELLHAGSVESACAHLADPTLDAILLDLDLPDLSGLDAVATVHAGSVGQPIVVLTGRSGGDLALEALRMGAQDYLIKDAITSGVLVRAIHHAIERQRLLTHMRHSVRGTSADMDDFRRLLQQGTEALLVLDPQRRVQFANQHAVQLFGLPIHELRGRPFPHEVIPGLELEQEIARPDGSKVVAEIRSVNVMWREREAVLVSLRDISERRTADEQRLRLELLTGFLGSMSHELRTPLSAVYQFVSNVRDGVLGPVNAEQYDHLGAALRNVDESLGMVANLLEVARAEGGKLRFDPRLMRLEVELQPVLSFLSNSATKAGIRLETDLPESLPWLIADPARVRQSIANLLENAIKFTPRGGSILLKARGAPDADRVSITVTDTGCGVPSEHLDRIFDQLHQVPNAEYRTRRGLGLGLHITRELVRAQGGEIRVESEAGKGSRFEILLPAFRWESRLERLADSTDAGTARTALVVDIGWPDDAHGEPIPTAIVSTIAQRLEGVLADSRSATIPPVVLENCLRAGAIVAACATDTQTMATRLRETLAIEPSLAESALEVFVRVEEFVTEASKVELAALCERAERTFMDTSSRGAPCTRAA